jgi:hypothetical protein
VCGLHCMRDHEEDALAGANTELVVVVLAVDFRSRQEGAALSCEGAPAPVLRQWRRNPVEYEKLSTVELESEKM